MIKILYKNLRDTKFTEITKYKKGSLIYCYSPTEEEINYLVDKYGLDESLLQDALDQHEMPRIEIEDNTKYLFLRYPVKTEDFTDTSTILIATAEEFTVILCKQQFNILNKLEKNTVTTTQKTKLLIHVLSEINLDFKKSIHSISRRTRQISKNIEKITNEEIIKLVEYEKLLNEYLSSLVPANLVYEQILKGKIYKMYEEDADLIEDLLLQTHQLIEIAKSTNKYIVNIRESFATILSNNLNKTMKTLTSITVILTIPTIVTSFYGMNVSLPGQTSPLAYFYVLTGTALLSIFLILFFAYKKLL